VPFYNSTKNTALLLKRCIFYESGTYHSVQFSVICLYPYTDTLKLGPYSQHIIFIVTYELTQEARVLYGTRLERLTRDKHFNLLDLFVSYKENEVM